MRAETSAGAIAATAAIAALIAGTGGAAAQRAAAPPPELLATVALGPDATLDGVRAFVNAVRPGAGALFAAPLLRKQLAELAGATSLEGLDARANTYLLGVQGGGLEGAVIVGKVADAQRLAAAAGPSALVVRNGWAVIGPKAIAERVAAYATSALAAQPVLATLPTLTLHGQPLMRLLRPKLGDARKQLQEGMAGGGASPSAMAAGLERYFDGLVSAVGDSERVVVSLEVTKDSAAVDLALVPRPGSRLAKFTAAQRPSDYALLGKLPAAGSPVLVAGHLSTGPYRAGFIEAASLMYGQPPPKDFGPAIASMMQAATGEIAMAMAFGKPHGMQMLQLLGLDDAKAADRAVRVLLEGFARPRTTTEMGVKTTIVASPRPGAHDGVTLRGYDMTIDVSAVPAANRAALDAMMPGGAQVGRVAIFDGLAAIAGGADGAAAARAMIDAARGKAKRYAPPPAVADFLAGSRARRESLAVLVDAGALSAALAPAGAPAAIAAGAALFMMSLGFGDQSMHLRLTVPAATIRTLATGAP